MEEERDGGERRSLVPQAPEHSSALPSAAPEWKTWGDGPCYVVGRSVESVDGSECCVHCPGHVFRTLRPTFCIREMGRLRTEDRMARASRELCAQASGFRALRVSDMGAAPGVARIVKPWSENKEREKVVIFLQIVMFF